MTRLNRFKNQKGLSLVEIILAIALFSLFSVPLIFMLMNSYGSNFQAEEKDIATIYAQQGIEAVKSIRRQAWNFLENGSHGLDASLGYWQFLGVSEILDGKYTRTIIVEDVCRSVSNDITECSQPDVEIDLYTKKVTSRVTYDSINGFSNQIELNIYLTSWQSEDFVQTNWSGGAGQSIWLADNEYDSDDSNIETGVGGQISLKGSIGNGCGTKVWDFSTPENYVYDPVKIEVTNGLAQLVGGEWWSGNYSYRRQLTVSTGNNPPYNRYSGYTVRISNFDSAALVAQGKMQSDCDDLRVVYFDGLSNYTELDRQVISCNTSATEIRFALELDISDSSLDDKYYIYYGNVASVSGPQNLSNIYLWYDDTISDKSGSYTFGRCDNWHGSGYNAWAYDGANDYFYVNTGDNVTSCFRYPANERDAYIEAELYHTGCYSSNMTSGVLGRYVVGSGSGGTESASHYYASNRAHQSSCGGGYSHDGDICESNRCNLGINGANPSAISINQWRKQGMAIWGINNTSLKFWDSNTVSGFGPQGWPLISTNAFGSDSSDKESPGAWGVIAAQDNIRAKNILIRRYTEPEPSVSVGGEETGGSYFSDRPSVNPVTTYIPNTIDSWSAFTETANKNGGQVYYQLSDNGTNWYYWDGVDWANAGATDYNEAGVVDSNIGIFSTTTGEIMFKAFLESDGSQQIQIDEIKIGCQKNHSWPFSDGADYTYDNQKIEVTGGVARLKSAFSASGGILNGDFEYTTDTSYNWPFTTAGDYSYDSNYIEITGGAAQLVDQGVPGSCSGMATACNSFSSQPVCDGQAGCLWNNGASASISNPGFNSNANGWTYTDWEQANRANGRWTGVGGNAGGYINVSLTSQRNTTASGYWYQSFTTTAGVQTATLNFDWRIVAYNGTGITSYILYAFVDTINPDDGPPVIGTEVWSQTISGTTSWNTSPNINIQSEIPAAGTYYLKLVARRIQVNANGGTNTVGFDNVSLSWTEPGLCSGTATACGDLGNQVACEDQAVCSWAVGYAYPTNKPRIYPNDSYAVSGVLGWTSFTETATKNGGQVYYQLSDDDGSTWQWWNAGSWLTASNATDYNIASVVNSNISSFSTANDQIKFKAFLESDGSQQIQLDSIGIGFTPFASVWNFDNWGVGILEPTPTGSVQTSGGNPGKFAEITIPLGFFSTVGGYWQQPFTTNINNPSSVDINFDYKVLDYNGSPITAEIRVYLDSSSGDPINQVGSSIDVSGQGSWTSAAGIDASSAVTSAGTYYLKMALWVQAGFFTGPYQIGFDNVSLSWSGVNYPTDKPTINPVLSYTASDLDEWSGFLEIATKNGGEIYYQLSDNGSDWQWWDSSTWSVAAGVSDYNTAQSVDSNIGAFSTSSGQISFKAFLASNGNQQIQLDDLKISWGEPMGTGGYATAGYLISSAYDMGEFSSVNIIEWDEVIPICSPSCDIKLQVRTAPDLGGSPGVWSDWYGESGSGTYFTNATGTKISTDLNFNQWLQYRAELSGDGNDTPILEEVRINYTP